MAKFELNLQQINQLCTNITVTSESKGWFEVAESDKKIHGSKKLLEFNDRFEGNKGQTSQTSQTPQKPQKPNEVVEEEEKIKESIEILNSSNNQIKFYDVYERMIESDIEIDGLMKRFKGLKKGVKPENGTVNIDGVVKCIEDAIECYNIGDKFDINPDEIKTYGDYCIAESKQLVNNIIRSRIRYILYKYLPKEDELTQGTELLTLLKTRKEYKYLDFDIDILPENNFKKILPESEYFEVQNLQNVLISSKNS